MALGIEVARSFFEGWGLPYLESEYPHLVERVVAVLCHGSQSLGNDDESARRRGFATYPDLVWKWRARDDLWNVWHFGQYNFLQRLTLRRDPVAIALALGKVCEGVMRLYLVLEHQYCPYWKWLAAQFRKTARCGGDGPMAPGPDDDTQHRRAGGADAQDLR